MMSLASDAAGYVDALIAAGYTLHLVEGSQPWDFNGFALGFPEKPLAADPLLDAALSYPRTPEANAELVVELRRRGLIIRMERHEVTQ